VPIGVNTTIDGDTLTLVGIVASLDGQQLIKDTVTGTPADAENMGKELAQRLRSQGAQEILDVINAENRS
jgi:hydroxymethylbilane synthase